MKSKTTTDEDQLIHFEQINLQEVGTDRDATEESKYEREASKTAAVSPTGAAESRARR